MVCKLCNEQKEVKGSWLNHSTSEEIGLCEECIDYINGLNPKK